MRVLSMTEKEMREDIVNDLKANIFVEAGAGAGKTRLIVDRIVNLLRNGADPSEIVAITFTKAAAEELRIRIMNALKDEGLNDILSRFDRIQISTIHSFCNVLISEQALSAGLPIDMELMEEEETAEQKRKLFEEFLSGLTEADWDQLEASKPEGYQRYNIRNLMEEMYMAMADLPEDCMIKIPEKESDFSKILQDIEKLKLFVDGDKELKMLPLKERVINAINACITKKEREKGQKELSSLKDIQNIFCGADKGVQKEPLSRYGQSLMKGSGDYDALMAALASGKALIAKSNFKSVIDKTGIEDKNKELSEEFKDYAASCGCEYLFFLYGKFDTEGKRKNKLEQKMDVPGAIDYSCMKFNMGRTACEYAVKARKYYREKLALNKMSNDRLLELTYKMVFTEDKKALRCFADKYKHYFVDEFQDTDRIQEGFIYRLASEVDDPGKLREGALFVVGDPKQSIYRFRGAQPEIYFETKNKMEAADNAKVYVLSHNYRSNEDIIEWVNDKFTASDSITPIVNGAGAQGYQGMTHVKDIASDNKVIAGVYHVDTADPFRILDIKKDNGDPLYAYSEWTSEEDKNALIKIIKTLTSKDDNGTPLYWITDYDADNKPFSRGIKYSDFLLISPQKDKMGEYVSVLTRYNIPVVLDGKYELNADKYFCVYARVLRFLLNPRDNYLRLGALEALSTTFDTDSKTDDNSTADDILACLYESVKGMSPYGVADFLERQLSVWMDKDKAMSRTELLISQSHIRQMVEWICTNSSDAATQMTDTVQRYIDEGIEHELPLAEGVDAVRFMNLHKTKGLDGGIVIIMDRRMKAHKKAVNMINGSEYYPGMKSWSALKFRPEEEYMQEQPGQPYSLALASDAAEFHRLEYVAVTRAKQAVIFMGTIPQRSNTGGIFAGAGLVTNGKPKDLPKDMGFPVFDAINSDAFDYQIRDTADMMELIGSGIDVSKYKPENPPAYDVSSDAYLKDDSAEHTETGIVKRKSPSRLEAESDTIEKAKDDAKKSGKTEDYGNSIKRPVGEAAGDILHKAMELLVALRWDKKALTEDDIRSCSIQALYHNTARLDEVIGAAMSREDVEGFAFACAKAYNAYLDEIWDGIEAVYPEVGFSYASETDDGNKTWMNGTADLVIKMKDGSYTLYDYKSNNDKNVPEAVMELGLREIYMPQLTVYYGVIRDMFNVSSDDITVAIISFSQKDEKGNILGGDGIRVRCTQIKVTD